MNEVMLKPIDVDGVTWKELFGYYAAANDVALLENNYFQSGAGKIAGRNESVVAGAYHNDVIA
jgi:hypothetical protein